MTLRDDLERRSERGEPRGAENVFMEALAWSDELSNVEVPRAGASRTGRIAVAVTGVAASAALLIAAVAIVAGSSNGDMPTTASTGGAGAVPSVSSVEPPDSPPPTAAPPSPLSEEERAALLAEMKATMGDDVAMRDGRIGVGGPDPDVIGWVDPYSSRAPDFGESRPAVPIYDDQGEQIAWWGFALGWIDLDTMADPTYDYDAEWSEYWEFGERMYG